MRSLVLATVCLLAAIPQGEAAEAPKFRRDTVKVFSEGPDGRPVPAGRAKPADFAVPLVLQGPDSRGFYTARKLDGAAVLVPEGEIAADKVCVTAEVGGAGKRVAADTHGMARNARLCP